MEKEEQTAGMSDESIGIFLAVFLLLAFAAGFYKMGFDAGYDTPKKNKCYNEYLNDLKKYYYFKNKLDSINLSIIEDYEKRKKR